jgi:hypothetical protein
VTAYKPKIDDLVLVAGREGMGVGTIIRLGKRMGFPTATVHFVGDYELAASYSQLRHISSRVVPQGIDEAKTDDLKETLSEVDTLCGFATLSSGSRVSLERVRAWLTTELNRRNAG